MDQNLLVYVLIFTNGLMAVGLLALLFSFKKLIKRGKKHLRFEEKIKQAEKFIAEAEIEARETLLRASGKSSEILENAEFFKKDLEGDFEGILRETFDEIRREVGIVFKKASEDFALEAKRDMELFSNNLHSETENIKGVITEGITESIKKAEEEIDAYREERLKNIDKEVKTKVDSISKQVLGKSLDIDDHLKLIKQSLIKAKQENVL